MVVSDNWRITTAAGPTNSKGLIEALKGAERLNQSIEETRCARATRSRRGEAWSWLIGPP